MAIPGYFKQPEATAALYDEEGFIRTGDIMEERARDALVYLDRSNDVLKLSQGEFVAIGALGSTFETGCPAIQQMYVYGNSARSFLLAVIVPDKQVVETRLGANPDESELRALIREERSEEHTSELQSLMRISYAVFYLKKKNYNSHLSL